LRTILQAVALLVEKVIDVTVRSLPRVNVHAAVWLIVVIDTPFVAHVPEAIKDNVPVVYVVVALNVKFLLRPVIFPEKVNDDPVVVQSRQAGLVPKGIVPDPEFASKTASSVLVGGGSPPVPPDDNDQFKLFVLSHVPAPPTQ
jgi:hypothetical protein